MQKSLPENQNPSSASTAIGLPEDSTVFMCPAAKMVRQLLSDIAEIKKHVSKNTADKEALIDNVDLMKEYHISRTTAAEWRANGLCYVKVGKKLFYKKEDVSAFLEKHKHRGF